MSKEEVRDQLTPETENGVVEEIKEQDLENQAAGGSMISAIQLTFANKCGYGFTVSYECTNPHKACN